MAVHITRMKMSIAIAIIRNKPSDMTGQEYAKLLANRIKTRQLQWKQRCQDVKAEVLHLKQQLVLHKHITGDASQQDQSSTQKSDDLMQTDSQPLFPTPPASGSAQQTEVQGLKFSSQSGNLDGGTLAKHTCFLQKVKNLHAGCFLAMGDNNVQKVVHESLLKSLTLLQEHLVSAEYSWTLQKNCVNVIVCFLDKSTGKVLKGLVERVTDLCGTLISKIVSVDDSHLQQNEIKEQLVSVLVEFSKSHHLLPPVLTELCQCLYNYSDELSQVHRQELSMDPFKFCNMYYIIQACEKCLTVQSARITDESLQNNLRSTLEDSLLHLTNTFPLFAHGIWRLCQYL